MKGRKLTLVLGIVFVLMIEGLVVFMPSETRGNPGTVYVDDDADPNWYYATPVRTIQEGIGNATAGNTVFAFNCIYHTNFSLEGTNNN